MKVYVERNDKSVNVKAKTVAGLLKKLKLNPTTVLVSVNKEIVTEEKKLNDTDDIIIHSVISGG